MIFRKLPSQKYLQACLDYNPATGKLFWKKRPTRHFVDAHAAATWNTRFAGKEAFISNQRGYKTGRVAGIIYFANRIVWKLVTGQETSREIEHQDRNPGNNKWTNLRLAHHYQNGANKSLHRNNKSGVAGVTFNKTEQKWKAHIRVRGKRISLGTYTSKNKAVFVRKVAEKKYFKEFAP